MWWYANGNGAERFWNRKLYIKEKRAGSGESVPLNGLRHFFLTEVLSTMSDWKYLVVQKSNNCVRVDQRLIQSA